VDSWGSARISKCEILYSFNISNLRVLFLNLRSDVRSKTYSLLRMLEKAVVGRAFGDQKEDRRERWRKV
jgi:hypothetical protein